MRFVAAVLVVLLDMGMEGRLEMREVRRSLGDGIVVVMFYSYSLCD